jgi:hypothetical protein
MLIISSEYRESVEKIKYKHDKAEEGWSSDFFVSFFLRGALEK